MSLFSIYLPIFVWGAKILIQQADSGVCWSKNEILNYLLEGTHASHLEKSVVEEADAATRGSFSSGTLYILMTYGLMYYK